MNKKLENEISNEKKEILTDSKKIQRTIRTYFKIFIFHQTRKSKKRYIYEIEGVIKNILNKQSPEPNGSSEEFCITLKY